MGHAERWTAEARAAVSARFKGKRQDPEHVAKRALTLSATLRRKRRGREREARDGALLTPAEHAAIFATPLWDDRPGDREREALERNPSAFVPPYAPVPGMSPDMDGSPKVAAAVARYTRSMSSPSTTLSGMSGSP